MIRYIFTQTECDNISVDIILKQGVLLQSVSSQISSKSTISPKECSLGCTYADESTIFEEENTYIHIYLYIRHERPYWPRRATVYLLLGNGHGPLSHMFLELMCYTCHVFISNFAKALKNLPHGWLITSTFLWLWSLTYTLNPINPLGSPFTNISLAPTASSLHPHAMVKSNP